MLAYNHSIQCHSEEDTFDFISASSKFSPHLESVSGLLIRDQDLDLGFCKAFFFVEEIPSQKHYTNKIKESQLSPTTKVCFYYSIIPDFNNFLHSQL